jgi:hypothetical protein
MMFTKWASGRLATPPRRTSGGDMRTSGYQDARVDEGALHGIILCLAAGDEISNMSLEQPH